MFDKDLVLGNANKGYSKYATGFDYLMHDYVIQRLSPCFCGDDVVELGSYKGEMTKKLLECFKSVTALELLPELCENLKKIPSNKLSVVNGDFMHYEQYDQFSDIVSCHSLEHIEDHIKLLTHIKKHKKPSARLHVVVPNAMSLSRQIAVKMGYMTHEQEVTEFEKSIGHFHTFRQDGLKHDLEAVGYKILASGGIMPKVFSNGQYDKALEQEIVDKKYLDAAFLLSDKYPELCASIFFTCE